MDEGKKRFWIAVSIIIGTCIGAGILSLPYIAAQSGFFVTAVYIILIGLIVLLIDLYLGEIALRTKGYHQIAGYAKKYLGQKGRILVEFAIIFGIFASIVAYLVGISSSLNILFFHNSFSSEILGIFAGLMMSFLFYHGVRDLKKFEKWVVSIILILLLAIFFIFMGKVEFSNISYLNLKNILLPFGVVLFALNSFQAIPEARLILKDHEKYLKKVIITAIGISIFSYLLFSFVISGSLGQATPEIATIALGPIFILLGIFTMFTSYLALGNALMEDFMFDDRLGRKLSLFLAGIVPIFIFLLTRFFKFFSFTRILSIGGVISGGLISILIMLMIGKSKKMGKRKSEYSIPVHWGLLVLLIILFIFGIISEIF